MDKVKLTQTLRQEVAGFKDIRVETEKVTRDLSRIDCLKLADEMYNSDIYQ